MLHFPLFACSIFCKLTICHSFRDKIKSRLWKGFSSITFTLRICFVVCNRLGEQQVPETTQLFDIHGLKHVLRGKNGLFIGGTCVLIWLNLSQCNWPSAIQRVDKCFYEIPARLCDVEPAAMLCGGFDLPTCHRESSHWTPLNHTRPTNLLDGRQVYKDHTRYLKKHATVSTWGITMEFFWTAAPWNPKLLFIYFNLLKIQLQFLWLFRFLSILHGVDDKGVN